jgi:hypothetical protein
MSGGFAPRFAVEAGFLILLGVGSGLANLRDAVIVAVLAGGWLLVSLVELSVWRAQARPVGRLAAPASVEAEPEPEPAIELEQEPAPAEPPPDVAYPLRADAGSEPSEEIEAYTRIIEDERADEPPEQRAD